MLSIQYLLVFSMIYLILFHFLDFEKKNDVKWVNLIIFMMLGIFDIIRQIRYGYQPIREYDALIGLGAVFLIGLYALSEFKSWRTWLTIGLAIFISTFISTVTAGFVLTVLGRDLALLTVNATYNIIGGGAAALLLFILNQITKKMNLKINAYALNRVEIGFIIFFLLIFGFFVTAIYTLGGASEDEVLGALMSFLALLSGVIGIYFVIYLATQKSVIKDVQSREKQQELIFYEQEQNYERMNARNEEIRIFRHNIEDELLYLHDLLYGCETEKAIAYVTKMRGNLAIIDQSVGKDTGSKAVNASWYALVNAEKYADITATWIGKIPHYIGIDNRDMVLLFSNLLSNAFEAAKESSDKYVIVKVNGKETGLFMSVKNSYQNEVKKSLNGGFVTSKADKENHGIGTRIIKNVIEKYDGEIEFVHSGDAFTVLISFSGNIY